MRKPSRIAKDSKNYVCGNPATNLTPSASSSANDWGKLTNRTLWEKTTKGVELDWFLADSYHFAHTSGSGLKLWALQTCME
jgi:hypothetical protein